VGTFGSFALRRRTPAVEATPLQLRSDPPARPLAAPVHPPVAVPEVPAAAAPPPPAADTQIRVEQAPIEAPVAVEQEAGIDFLAAAEVCTELARVESASQMEPLLRDLARILDAKGLIVWIWDSIASELRPALAHGYSSRVLAQLPGLGRDADNVTAAAFRSARACAITGRPDSSGALALPLLTPAGCSGVLAIELPAGASQAAPIRAAATFFAAVLAQLIPGGTDAEAPAAASAQG
jgi:hypothetical protein